MYTPPLPQPPAPHPRPFHPLSLSPFLPPTHHAREAGPLGAPRVPLGPGPPGRPHGGYGGGRPRVAALFERRGESDVVHQIAVVVSYAFACAVIFLYAPCIIEPRPFRATWQIGGRPSNCCCRLLRLCLCGHLPVRALYRRVPALFERRGESVAVRAKAVVVV